MDVFLLIGLLFLFIFIRIPIGFALVGAPLFYLYVTGVIPVQAVFHRMTAGADSFVLLSIPFFILAGNLMNRGGITNKIFKFANDLVGTVPGGLAHANVVASIIFAGMTGSAVADAGGLGAIEMKAMREQGFSRKFSAAVTAASSTIGPIVPPSVPMVVYGVMAEVSVGALFIAGFIPGLLMGLMTMVLIFIISVKRKYPRSERFDMKELWSSFRAAFFPMLTPVIIIGGILSGVFTPTEAASIAVLYALVLSLFVYRDLKFKELIPILVDSLKTTATVTIIIAAATSFSYLIALQGVPTALASWMTSMDVPIWVFLLFFNIIFLVIGTFMEALAVLAIVVPALVPTMAALGLDPLHIGVVLVLNLMIGLITPPMGMTLFITSKVGGVKLEVLYKEILIFIVPLIFVLLITTYAPGLIMWAPRLFGL